MDRKETTGSAVAMEMITSSVKGGVIFSTVEVESIVVTGVREEIRQRLVNQPHPFPKTQGK